MGRKFLILVVSVVALSTSGASASSQRVWIDNFERHDVKSFPKGWEGRSDDAHDFYSVAEEDGNKYLRVANRATHEFVGRKKEVDIVKYPMLEWRWRATALPQGANESIKSRADSGAAINVLVSASKLKPKTIKYVWSSTLRKGTHTESPYCSFLGQCDVIVVESGTKNMGSWRKMKRNVLEDYKRLHGKTNVDELVIDGILVMSDGDNTHSMAAADYDDIRFSRR